MELILKIEVCIGSKRIRQKEQTSTGIISSATNLHILNISQNNLHTKHDHERRLKIISNFSPGLDQFKEHVICCIKFA